jgi:2-polyprenyl-6-hydroxyphenyl methylase/3-demethylubiquinone-9 3-methyltransferase
MMSYTAKSPATGNVDPAELAKFSALAHRWWDPESEFKPLHAINPVRMDWIETVTGGIKGKRVLDVGCGGGILTEAMAVHGGLVTGIDLGEKALGVAKLHKLETGVAVDYRLVAAETLAAESPGTFDVVTCMEMLEHVPDPASIVKGVCALLKPGGQAFFSTLNRTPLAFMLGIVGAEHIARLLPRGTHRYDRFIRPSELSAWIRAAGLQLRDIVGLHYNPLTRSVMLGGNVQVNYLLHAVKPAP